MFLDRNQNAIQVHLNGRASMAYPYIPSGGLIQTAFQQFRKSFPAKVDSETLKKLGIASGNEGALINILKFLSFLDKDNQRTKDGSQLFSSHDDAKFSSLLAEKISSSYRELFDLHGETAWSLDRDALISFFRSSDETSSVTGARQSLTFQTLSTLAGKRADTIPTRASSGPRKSTNSEKPRAQPKPKSPPPNPTGAAPASDPKVGLTVRIEINLPANGSQATYDNIFQSIRKNLINVE